MKHRLLASLAALAASFLAGCSSYVTPGPKAELDALAPADIQAGFAVKPSNPFPAAIAAVRLQGTHYRNYNLDGQGGAYGTGRYSVVTVREVEEDETVARLAKLPGVAGLVSLNRMLLPPRLDTEKELRLAASRLQADLLLLYTFDTAFFSRDTARPLTAITLGTSPTHKIRVTTTASALLLDTRTGFIYSAYEATEQREVRASVWTDQANADRARRDAEKAAFAKLAGEFETAWPQLLARFGKIDSTAATASTATAR